MSYSGRYFLAWVGSLMLTTCTDSPTAPDGEDLKQVMAAWEAEALIARGEVVGEADDLEMTLFVSEINSEVLWGTCAGHEVKVDVYTARDGFRVETLTYPCVPGSSLDRLTLPRAYDTFDKVVVVKVNAMNGEELVRRLRIPAGISVSLKQRSRHEIPRSEIEQAVEGRRGDK